MSARSCRRPAARQRPAGSSATAWGGCSAPPPSASAASRTAASLTRSAARSPSPPAWEKSSGEDRREVSVGDGEVPGGWLELAAEQVHWRRAGGMIFRQIVHEGHPVGIDVELH